MNVSKGIEEQKMRIVCRNRCKLCINFTVHILPCSFCLQFVIFGKFVPFLFFNSLEKNPIISNKAYVVTRYGRNPNCTLDISLSFFNVLYGITSINKLQIFHSLTALCSYLNCASTIASNYKIPQKGASNCLRKN